MGLYLPPGAPSQQALGQGSPEPNCHLQQQCQTHGPAPRPGSPRSRPAPGQLGEGQSEGWNPGVRAAQIQSRPGSGRCWALYRPPPASIRRCCTSLPPPPPSPILPAPTYRCCGNTPPRHPPAMLPSRAHGSPQSHSPLQSRVTGWGSSGSGGLRGPPNLPPSLPHPFGIEKGGEDLFYRRWRSHRSLLPLSTAVDARSCTRDVHLPSPLRVSIGNLYNVYARNLYGP